MTQAILFDLDGTLLASELEEQITRYLQRLTLYAREHLPAQADTLAQDIMGAVKALVDDHDPCATVDEKFFSRYCAQTDTRREEVEPVLDRFYATVYGEVGEAYAPVPQILEAVKLCGQKGLKMCVATNCFYPLRAVEWRIRWAGLDPEDFQLITHYENMHFTKPSLAYFREAAVHLGVPPAKCAMVGNDCLDDMVAAELGMQTFLLTPFLLHDTGYDGPRGGYVDLLEWVKTL